MAVWQNVGTCTAVGDYSYLRIVFAAGDLRGACTVCDIYSGSYSYSGSERGCVHPAWRLGWSQLQLPEVAQETGAPWPPVLPGLGRYSACSACRLQGLWHAMQGCHVMI